MRSKSFCGNTLCIFRKKAYLLRAVPSARKTWDVTYYVPVFTMLIFAILLISLSSYADNDNDQLFSEETLKPMVAANPDNLALRNALGGSYSNSKQYDKAETEFKKIIELAPDFAPVYVNYGIMEEERGDFRKGIKYLTGVSQYLR